MLRGLRVTCQTTRNIDPVGDYDKRRATKGRFNPFESITDRFEFEKEPAIKRADAWPLLQLISFIRFVAAVFSTWTSPTRQRNQRRAIIYTNTHTHIYIYIYICMYLCMYLCI